MINVKVLKEDKKEMDLEMDNVTIAELLRAYLNEEGAKLAVWKREHPFKNPILHIEVSEGSPKALVKKAISTIEKEIDKAVEEFKKLK